MEVDCEASGVAGQGGAQTSFLLSAGAGENSKCLLVPVTAVRAEVTTNNNDKHRHAELAGNNTNTSAVSTQQNNLNTSYSQQHQQHQQHHLQHLHQHQQQQYHHQQQQLQPRHNNHHNGKHWNTMVRQAL